MATSMKTSVDTDSAYIRNAMTAEYLDADTERELALAWRDHQDEAALHRLTSAYMRLAISMAGKYRRYGAPMNDLIQEASVGLMKAAVKFDPGKEVRFSTYAVWWIRASIQDYVMRNWSLVRTGSTSPQKSLFFNMRRVRAQLEREMALTEGGSMTPELRLRISEVLGAPLRDVEAMEHRLAGPDFSLNAPQGGDEDSREWVELLEDPSDTADETVARDTDRQRARGWISQAFDALTDRERMIVCARKLNETPETLESLGGKLKLSKERVRQLEAQALVKMRRQLEGALGSQAGRLIEAI